MFGGRCVCVLPRGLREPELELELELDAELLRCRWIG